MAGSKYKINKGINKSMEFKGLKSQYIWYLGIGLVVLLVLFAIIYIIGVNTYVCLAIILLLGGTLFSCIYTLSNKYGEYGMMKKAAQKMLPTVVKNNTRKIFIKK
ncbi:MAG: DUF4133 domain-containing protein [Bacteroidota bacterium]